MDNKNITEVFQEAVDNRNFIGERDSYNRSVAQLEGCFLTSYKLAEDEITKQALIKSLTDYIVALADKAPTGVFGPMFYAENVETLCNFLADTVKDKSPVPTDFPTRLTAAAKVLYREWERLEATGYRADGECVAGATRKIAAAARQLRRTQTLTPAQLATSLDSVGRRGKIGQQP